MVLGPWKCFVEDLPLRSQSQEFLFDTPLEALSVMGPYVMDPFRLNGSQKDIPCPVTLGEHKAPRARS